MNISRYQRYFGVGLLNVMISLFLFAILWLLDRKLGHVEISGRSGPIRIFGFALIGLWFCWHAWCVKTIRLWWSGGQLCTTGPYRLVRHPIYAGGLALAFPGISLMFNSWILFLAPVIDYLILFFLVRKEELMMITAFGEDYKRYAARTGRLFPRLFW